MPSFRLYHTAEEGKRSDDYVGRGRNLFIPSVLFWRGPSRFRRRRILPVVFVILLVYFLWASFSLGPSAQGVSGAVRGSSTKDVRGRSDETNKYYYNGPVGFRRLAYTVYSASWRWRRNNVLFAAASLQSASTIVPIACEMARYRRNTVHFILVGRDDISIEELLLKNGVGDGCDVHWHDGRPTHSDSSTEFRMELSVFEALGMVNRIMNLRVIIVDDLEEEVGFFARSIRTKVHGSGIPVIELPRGAAENLMWMTRLDCGSLSAWNYINIEIIVQVAPGESGSLIRLLKSLENADYFSSLTPGVTIELPPSIDIPTLQFLEGYTWPPTRPGGQGSGRLRLQRRYRHDATAEESSMRFLELFFPANPRTSHVLVLSPRVELSPLFYHYLKYALLEHKYSSYGFQISRNLIGIALNLPSVHPNTTLLFNPPLIKPHVSGLSRPVPEAGQATAFLWQAPGSDAVLYFGETWIEFQEFLSSRLDALRELPNLPQRPKAINPRYPPWMEYLSELSRVRGYLTLYPNWESGGSFAIVHADPISRTPHSTGHGTPDHSAQSSAHLHREAPLISRTSLVHILPADGDLPELSSIPLLSFDGQRISPSTLDAKAADYAAEFRKEIGGCVDPRGFDVRSSDIRDLFCLEDEDWIESALPSTKASD